MVWGLDLVEPLKKAPEGYTHFLVAVNKFSKWIEVWPITKIKSEQAVLFFCDITNNGTQFTGKEFLRFYNEHHIRVDWAAVAHPRMNGQVERVNGMILQGIKPRIFNKLNRFGKRWVAKLPTVLWSLRTTPSRATGHTPFFMVYGTKAILPIEIDYGAPRVMQYREQEAKEYPEDAMDQLDEAHDVALLHSTKYQQALR
jgi:transposase InsO family protein